MQKAIHFAPVGALLGSYAGYSLVAGAVAGAAVGAAADYMNMDLIPDEYLPYLSYGSAGAVAGMFLMPGDQMYMLGGGAAGLGAAYYAGMKQ